MGGFSRLALLRGDGGLVGLKIPQDAVHSDLVGVSFLGLLDGLGVVLVLGGLRSNPSDVEGLC
ncbi:hypothetical protein IscW_ISCW015516 [Ixodes scapularis]|uniref:Uncharacterized protein n=1 Tax=Ixodes scapularis TaxID=6945 RepID=B7QNX2_IXOSC|nr:hypothetical protein IscW_ISCW015516 [Ixodes scapularis]|eukprot:XP_002416627.1 hypothetical protein IscW_ISCW015516 [Ixodes scapularis]